MNRIAQNIYLYRLERGLSQKDLAVQSGVPQPNISQIEKGRDFKISTLYKIAAALDVMPDALIHGVKPLTINKQKFFQRGAIEKFAFNLANQDKAQNQTDVSRILSLLLSHKRPTKKRTDLSWMKLKQTFSRDEINTILSRFNKAARRREAHARAG